MDHWIRTVAQYRKELAEGRAHEEELNKALWQTPEYAALDQHQCYMANLKRNAEEAEAGLREAALNAYARTGATHPHPAVLVKLYTVASYDTGTAKEYAMEHDIPNVLKLDAKAFEKVAEALGLPFVTFNKEPHATIASDLSKWLKEEGQREETK